jgi:hypothetical protein
LLHSHMTSYIYYCIISFIVIHSHKIPLVPCYLFHSGYMYDAIVSTDICLLINDINV